MSANLNCWPGALARIVLPPLHLKLNEVLNDKIVKLADRPSFVAYGFPQWELEEPLWLVLSTGFLGRPETNIILSIEDKYLRPILNPGEHEVDEVLIYAGAPLDEVLV
jgi:hypothetical protein